MSCDLLVVPPYAASAKVTELELQNSTVRDVRWTVADAGRDTVAAMDAIEATIAMQAARRFTHLPIGDADIATGWRDLRSSRAATGWEQRQ
jgi:hypothetical protein